MAMSVKIILAGANTFIADITATADSDRVLVVRHGLGSVPLDVVITHLQPEAQLGRWHVKAIGPETCAVTKVRGGRTGMVGPQVRVKLALPHSIVR